MNRIITFLAAASLLLSCSQHTPAVSVSGGKVQGIPSGTPGVMVYKGIPYAAPPVGNLRWKAPQAVKPWKGVRICDSFSPVAPQSSFGPGSFYGDEFYWQGTPPQDEDCLYLNVWAPEGGKDLPVVLWIHGGGYDHGYAYELPMDGEAWASRGVILVSINYRVGILGFLSHPELTAEQGQSGNYGFMDQIAALQWVHDNIAVFGGNPSRITVMGQSAGAMSVKTLLASPLSRGLLSGAIIQSGGGLGTGSIAPAPGVGQEYYDTHGKDIMDFAGLTSLEAMRAAPASAIFEAGGRYKSAGKGRLGMAPHLDGYSIPETFDEALWDGSMAPVPILIGYNKDDMAQLAGESVDRFCAVRDSLGFPVWEYEFLRDLPTDEAHPDSKAGAFHSAELWYVFGTLSRSWRPFTEADYALSSSMLDAWTRFCKTGNPGWAPYKHEAPFKQRFDIEPSVN